MHRNTLLLTVALAVIAALLIGINIGRGMSQSSAVPLTPVTTAAPTPISMLAYTSTSCGVSLQYPSNLTPVESTTSGTAFVDTVHPDQSIVLDCQPTIAPFAVGANAIESIAIPTESSDAATISGKIYHTVVAQNGSQVDKLVVRNAKKGVDVYVGGFGPTFQQIIASLKLL